MKVVCVGGGPAGLYFAILAKLRDRDRDVTVFERNPAGVTYGWGVTFSDELLDHLYRNDPKSAQEIYNNPASWRNQEVHVAGRQPVHLGGYGFAIGRKRLLDILARRAVDLGVTIHFQREVSDLAEFADTDLIVACDGANSRIRRLYPEHFQTTAEVGRNKYIWLGTQRVFDSFMFAFEKTPAGWIWFYSYPFDSDTTTFIVECAPQTWHDLGFHALGPEEGLRLLECIFCRHLDGYPLMDSPSGSGPAPWRHFTRITNKSWHHKNVVLMGDAAHTTHFSIGSGTTLAMRDAIALADSLDTYEDLPSALRGYAAQRRAELVNAQYAAQRSAEWFETVPDHIVQPTTKFAYSLWQRRGHYPLWRYHLQLATQVTALRKLRRGVSSLRHNLRSRRRMRLVDMHESEYYGERIPAGSYAPSESAR
jgi:2-polyprenyl-6-methoxyphenol hydroxylase-like FAD-dependent oxidoreductase